VALLTKPLYSLIEPPRLTSRLTPALYLGNVRCHESAHARSALSPHTAALNAEPGREEGGKNAEYKCTTHPPINIPKPIR